jgi:hypothetical protein
LDLAARQLAASPEFADGTWRDAEGRNLIEAIVAALGPRKGAALWRHAEERFLAVMGEPGKAHVGLPLATDRKRWPVTPELRLVTRERTC